MKPVKKNTFEQFKNLLNFAFNNERSSFYRDKYQKTGFTPDSDFRSLKDVKKIPLLTREELVQEDTSRLLFVPEEKVKNVFPTSGTTTGKSFITFHSKDVLGFPPNHELHQKKVLILFSPFHANLNPTLPQTKLVFFGNIFNLPASCLVASKLGINHVWTTPTLAILLKKYLADYPDFQENLRSLSLIGEMVSPEKKRLLQKFYLNKEIFINYGTSEMGGIPAMQCRALAKRSGEILFHLRVEDCYFEIINPETKEEVPLGEQGELIITNFINRATPLIRYRTGDLASFRENDCSCGAPGPLLKICGRINYDIAKVAGFELRSDMLERPLINLSSFLKDEFEAHIHETFMGDKPRIQIKLNLSLKEGVKESPELKQKIENELLENWRLSPRLNLKKAVEAGLFDFPQINFVQFPFSVKARRFLILH